MQSVGFVGGSEKGRLTGVQRPLSWKAVISEEWTLADFTGVIWRGDWEVQSPVPGCEGVKCKDIFYSEEPGAPSVGVARR
jgi:hypothetical protein